jgi:hypothetical protein
MRAAHYRAACLWTTDTCTRESASCSAGKALTAGCRLAIDVQCSFVQLNVQVIAQINVQSCAAHRPAVFSRPTIQYTISVHRRLSNKKTGMPMMARETAYAHPAGVDRHCQHSSLGDACATSFRAAQPPVPTWAWPHEQRLKEQCSSTMVCNIQT